MKTTDLANAAPGPLSASVLRDVSGVAAFAEEWAAFLADRAAPHPVYHCPAYVMAELRARPDYEPAVAVVRRDGRVVAILPGFVEVKTVGVALSVLGTLGRRTRVVRVFGSGIVIDRDAGRESCFRAAVTALQQAEPGAPIVAFEELERGTPAWEALTGPSGAGGGFRFARLRRLDGVVHRIRFPQTHAEYLRSLSANTRSVIKRRIKKLQAVAPGLRLVCVTAIPDVPAYLAMVDHVYNRSWQAGAFGSRPRNAGPDLVRLLAWADAGLLRGYVLADGDRALAFVMGVQYRGVFSYLETGFDLAVAALAPGLVLQAMVIEHLFEHDAPHTFDFGYGDSQQKRMFANDQTVACDACLVRGLGWRLAANAQLAVDSAEEWSRDTLRRLGADRAVRRILKHHAGAASPEEAMAARAG